MSSVLGVQHILHEDGSHSGQRQSHRTWFGDPQDYGGVGTGWGTSEKKEEQREAEFSQAALL